MNLQIAEQSAEQNVASSVFARCISSYKTKKTTKAFYTK